MKIWACEFCDHEWNPDQYVRSDDCRVVPEFINGRPTYGRHEMKCVEIAVPDDLSALGML